MPGWPHTGKTGNLVLSFSRQGIFFGDTEIVLTVFISAKSISLFTYFDVCSCIIPITSVNQNIYPEDYKTEEDQNNRVATAQGKQGIWKSIFPDRENTGNLPKKY